MNQITRWSLKVSRETDIALRTLLASRGGKKATFPASSKRR